MNKEKFKQLIAQASAIPGEYSTGYQMGLRRHFEGETFPQGGDGHLAWIDQQSDFGDGYRDGFLGFEPNPKGRPRSVAERVALYDKNMELKGGRKLNGIRLSPEAADSLAWIESVGESATAAINRLLIECVAKHRAQR